MNYIDAIQNQPPAEIDTLTAEIQVYKQQAGACIVEIGRRLIQAKRLLPHGQWASWLAEKAEFSERTAQRFMKVAEGYPNPTPVTDLGLSKALLLLQLPEEEREEFIETPHEVDGEEKAVRDMSKRELEKAIQERDEARKAAEAAQADAEKWKNTAGAADLKLKKATEEAREAAESLKDANEAAVRDAMALQESEAQRAGLAQKLRQLEEAAKAGPVPAEAVPDEETLERIRGEIRAEQAEALKAAEERAAEASARLEKAKNPAALRVSLCFEDVQAKIAVIESALRDLRGDQPEAADRFCGVISEYLEQAALAIGG